MRIQRKIGLAIMLVSIFTLLSSYLFTTPDKEAQLLQQIYFFHEGAVYSPKISELVITDYHWTTDMGRLATDEVRKAFDYKDNGNDNYNPPNPNIEPLNSQLCHSMAVGSHKVLGLTLNE